MSYVGKRAILSALLVSSRHGGRQAITPIGAPRQRLFMCAPGACRPQVHFSVIYRFKSHTLHLVQLLYGRWGVRQSVGQFIRSAHPTDVRNIQLLAGMCTATRGGSLTRAPKLSPSRCFYLFESLWCVHLIIDLHIGCSCQINSVHTMWASRSYTLAILIAVMSGVWPYAKLLAMLALWFVPCEPRYVPSPFSYWLTPCIHAAKALLL